MLIQRFLAFLCQFPHTPSTLFATFGHLQSAIRYRSGLNFYSVFLTNTIQFLVNQLSFVTSFFFLDVFVSLNQRRWLNQSSCYIQGLDSRSPDQVNFVWIPNYLNKKQFRIYCYWLYQTQKHCLTVIRVLYFKV